MAVSRKPLGARSFVMQWDGTAKMKQRLTQLGQKAEVAVAMALTEEAEAALADAQERLVPVRDGHLRGSGFVSPVEHSGKVTMIRLGFGGPAAPYAVAIHENPRAGKTGGVSPSGRRYKKWAKVGGWKYLEKALVRAPRRLNTRLVKILQVLWGK